MYNSVVVVLPSLRRCVAGQMTSFKHPWSALKLPGCSSCHSHKCPVLPRCLCMCGDTRAQRVCPHGAALELFMALSCTPGAGNSCGVPAHPSGPTGAQKPGKCHRFVNALFPLLLSLLTPPPHSLRGRSSGTGHGVRF